MTLAAIRDSRDLATVLNAQPATPEDAAETPRDWVAGIWVAGTVYPLDARATTDTLAVLADGTAAVRLSPKGKYCGVRDVHRTGVESYAEHWCPADIVAWTETGDARGVTRDWRAVYVWDANGFAEKTVYASLDEAQAAFGRERAELIETGRMLYADAGETYPGDEEDEEAEVPQVTVANVRALLDAPHEDPVMYVKAYDEDGDALDEPVIDVWAEALVPHDSIVIRRHELLDAIGDDADDEAIREYLPVLQDSVADA